MRPTSYVPIQLCSHSHLCTLRLSDKMRYDKFTNPSRRVPTKYHRWEAKGQSVRVLLKQNNIQAAREISNIIWWQWAFRYRYHIISLNEIFSHANFPSHVWTIGMTTPSLFACHSLHNKSPRFWSVWQPAVDSNTAIMDRQTLTLYCYQDQGFTFHHRPSKDIPR